MAEHEQEYKKDVHSASDQDILGSTDHEQHRAPPGEGSRAPLASEGAEHAQFSVYDGKGNESVAVVAENEEGRTSEGVGATTEEALEDARKPGELLGEGMNPKGH
ncbi:MAG TPA: hypothetical protein VHE80_03095 [Acidimicrobiales bacterium]|nr:hypothetical protein [Acidimicrobiales bacterium]